MGWRFQGEVLVVPAHVEAHPAPQVRQHLRPGPPHAAQQTVCHGIHSSSNVNAHSNFLAKNYENL